MSKKVNINNVYDVVTKGGVVGLVSYLFATYEIDPALNIVVLPVVLAVLNTLSTKVGDPQVANFFAKQSKVVEATVKETVGQPIDFSKFNVEKKEAPKKATPKKKKN